MTRSLLVRLLVALVLAGLGGALLWFWLRPPPPPPHPSGLPADMAVYLAKYDGGIIRTAKPLTIDPQSTIRNGFEAWCVDLEQPSPVTAALSVVLFRQRIGTQRDRIDEAMGWSAEDGISIRELSSQAWECRATTTIRCDSSPIGHPGWCTTDNPRVPRTES